jgi:O-antigen/teichoic acid export membrane protein
MSEEARKMVTGLGWVSAASYLNRAFGFVTTLILARLLAPDEFGAVAVGAMMVDALKIFRDMGLGQALIYRKDDSALANDTALTMILGINVLLFAVAIVTAPWVSGFFGDPSVTPVLIVMSANLIPIAIRSVPEALIRKHAHFNRLAVPEVAPVVLSSILGIVLAMTGFGVWALVARTLSATILAAVIIWFYVDYRPRLRFDRAIARELFHYGKFVFGATLLTVALYNVDKLYLGRFAGVGALGIYTMAWAVASIPVTEFGHLLCRVAFPIFCRVSTDTEKLRRIFLGSFRYNGMIVVPLGVGIGVFGPDLSRMFLGDKWAGIADPLRLLAVASLIRAMSSLIHELFRAVGQVKTVQTFTFTRLALLAALGIPALKWGDLDAMCLLILLSNLAVFIFEFTMAARLIGSSSFALIAAPAQAIGCSLLSFGAAYTAWWYLAPHESLLATLVAGAVGGAGYIGLIFAFNRTLVSEARQLFAKQPGGPA